VTGTGSTEGKLRYGGDEAFAPFESLDAQGRPRGFQIDLLEALAPLLGATFDVQLQPWARTEAAFRERRLDVIAMVDTDERRRWALFAHGHATPALALYHRRERAAPQDLSDLTDQRVAVLDGEAMRDTAAKWLGGLRGPLQRHADASAALAALAAGEADVALLPRAYADPALAARGDAALADSAVALRLQSYAFAVAPGNEALKLRLQQALEQLERSGRLEALRTQWLGSHREQAERGQLERRVQTEREWSWGIAGASATALLLLGVVLRQRGRRIALEQQGRRTAEVALQRAEEQLGRVFTHNSVPMLIVEQGSGTVRDANDALCALLGVEASALLGQPLRAQQQHLDAAVLEDLVRSLDANGALSAMPLRLARVDGQRRDCLVSADRMQLGDAVQLFCVVQDITQQLQRDAALRSEYEALAQQLAATREDLQQFTRAVSHDLKAPLRAVQGLAGLLRDRLRAGHVQEAIDYSQHIDRAALRMSTMLDALSRLAQVGHQALRRQAVDMQRLANETWALVVAGDPTRRVEWRVEALPPAQADPDLVAQVWQNLLDNAWKYSARTATPKVRVDSWRDDRSTWYRVTDNGAGFDMGRAGLLFQPFQRMHSSAQFAGTGVGLSLVRRIVELHGGEIRLRSSPGVGTVAEFTLEAPAVIETTPS
jgi:PAS domain S-box-containing protein